MAVPPGGLTPAAAAAAMAAMSLSMSSRRAPRPPCGARRRPPRARPAPSALSRDPGPAQLVQEASCMGDLQAAAERLVMPGTEDARGMPHMRQHVHQQRRQKTAARALAKAAKRAWGREDEDADAIARLAGAAAAPSTAQQDELGDAQNSADALHALASIAAAAPAIAPHALDADVLEHARVLAGRVAPFADELPLPAATGAKWACDRLGIDAGAAIADVAARVPFHVDVAALDRHPALDVTRLAEEVPLAREELITRKGQKVIERRATCWMAEDDVGGLAYSGKVMRPAPFVEGVAAVRDTLFERSGAHFDCVLINLYEDGECACRWHSDPEHGASPPAKWAQRTAVAMTGASRRFCFRPAEGAADADVHTFVVAQGDVVWMQDDCQDTWHHAVLKADAGTDGGPRISLVFKTALVQPSGAKGHPIHARRSRKARRQSRSAAGSPPRPRGDTL